MQKQRPTKEQGHRFASAFFMILIVSLLIGACVQGKFGEDSYDYDYEPASTYESDDKDLDGDVDYDDVEKYLKESLEDDVNDGDDW